MKKSISFVLVLVLVFTASIYGYAEESSVELEKSVLERKIEAAKAKEYAELYRQLDEQNALEFMNQFIAVLDPQIEAEVKLLNENSNSASMHSTNDYRLTFLDGGVTGYRNSIGANILSTYILPEASEKYIVEESTLTIGALVAIFLGYIPAWGSAMAGLFSLALTVTASQSSSIQAADGYAQVMNISDAAGIEAASYVRGWTTYPIVTLSTEGAYDIRYEAF